jgi:DNA ligase-associated metallophosphoesterase
MVIEVSGEVFVLFPQKAIYWEKEKTLLVADLHLGKVNHFRKAGIAVPTRANDHNLEMLIELIGLTRPKKIICLGDLFHSHYNPEWEVFGEFVRHFSQLSFELVIGNHDIMSELQYERKGIAVFDSLQMGPFLMTHHPMEEIPAGSYNLAGHIHPGVSLKGKGRQSITLPCFYFGLEQGFLPAFGSFTGLARITPRRDDRVFVVAENKIMFVS